MDAVISRIEAWLKANENKTIAIRKEEDGDVDEVEIRLDAFRIKERQAQSELDGYFAPASIQLEGSGTIRSETERAELPGGIYEIPVEGRLQTGGNGAALDVRSERAHYKLSVME